VVEDILVVIIGRADVQQDSEVCFREENKRLEKDDSGILGFCFFTQASTNNKVLPKIISAYLQQS